MNILKHTYALVIWLTSRVCSAYHHRLSVSWCSLWPDPSKLLAWAEASMQCFERSADLADTTWPIVPMYTRHGYTVVPHCWWSRLPQDGSTASLCETHRRMHYWKRRWELIKPLKTTNAVYIVWSQDLMRAGLFWDCLMVDYCHRPMRFAVTCVWRVGVMI